MSQPATTAGRQPAKAKPPRNTLLEAARNRLPSPAGAPRPMSRQELAEAINHCLWTTHQTRDNLDRGDIGAYERGEIRWPNDHRREAFRAVLGATHDHQLGFYTRKTPQPTTAQAPAASPPALTHPHPGGEGLGSRQAGGNELPVALGVRIHPTDGKAMAFVGEGAFKYGPDNQMVWLPAFWVDITPVTNIEYARFVDATGHRRPPHWPDGIYPDQLADHPVVNVTHTDATTYAAWAGKLLPSEQEWEKAARGPAGSTYPWGDQQTPAKCNVRETGVGATTPVGLYRSGVSPYGVYDLAGNVWEWCRTQTSPGRFVLKGSAFTSLFAAAAAAETNDAAAGMLDDDTGFRCVVPHDRVPPLVSG